MTRDEQVIAQALASFNLAAIGTDPTEDPTAPGSSYVIRNHVGNAYVEYVKQQAKATADAIKGKPVAEANEIQRQATVKLIAHTSLICGAMINFCVGSFVREKAARDDMMARVFKDIRTRVDEAQSELDPLRKLSSLERTNDQ